VFWAGSPLRFKQAIEGLERLQPGFRERYEILSYEDLAFLPESVLLRFNQVMANIGKWTKLLDQAGIPSKDANGRELSFWDRLPAAVRN
jgi:hypothetical protein